MNSHSEPGRGGVLGTLPSLSDFDAEMDDYASCDEQAFCCPEPKPGVLAFQEMVLTAYPMTSGGGIRRPCASGPRSEHKEGRAWDWRVSAADQAEVADELLDWLLAPDERGNQHAAARRWGVMYMIWDHRIWGAYAADEGWRPYRGPDPHVDHVHFSFSWDGALCRTSWWSSLGWARSA